MSRDHRELRDALVLCAELSEDLQEMVGLIDRHRLAIQDAAWLLADPARAADQERMQTARALARIAGVDDEEIEEFLTRPHPWSGLAARRLIASRQHPLSAAPAEPGTVVPLGQRQDVTDRRGPDGAAPEGVPSPPEPGAAPTAADPAASPDSEEGGHAR